MKLYALIAAIIVPSAAGSHAAILFADTFDRADTGTYNNNSVKGALDATLAGITDTTGSSLTAGSVYTIPHTTGGGYGILESELLLASGPGTSNAYINHNFTNSSITTAGGFSVTIDVTGYSGASNGQGGAFAVGMTQSEANAATDAIFTSPPAFTSAFGANTAVSDFWVGLRGDSTVAWGGAGITEQSGVVAAKTGTISADFTFADFNAGTTVNYAVSYNGNEIGTGTFTWSDANSNYIGLDARDGQGVTLDNLSIATIPEPGAAVLGALGLLAVLRRRR